MTIAPIRGGVVLWPATTSTLINRFENAISMWMGKGVQGYAHHEFCAKGVALEYDEPGLNSLCTSLLKFWRNGAKDICLRLAQGKPRAWPDYNAFKSGFVSVAANCRYRRTWPLPLGFDLGV